MARTGPFIKVISTHLTRQRSQSAHTCHRRGHVASLTVHYLHPDLYAFNSHRIRLFHLAAPVSGEGQRKAFTMAKSYAQNFGAGFASFVFSGSPGTGKNHLAAAIGNHLLSGGHSVLVVTIPDLMLRVRECYDGGQSEAALLGDLCKVDLLVLDEVGIQRGSNGEKVILNQIIDRRLSSMRPVGILTNLNHEELLGALGARVIDRLQMDGGMWVNFDWGSYRKNVSHLRSVK